jgi:hypothetical protein
MPVGAGPLHDFIMKTHEVIALVHDFIKNLDEVMFWRRRRGGAGQRRLSAPGAPRKPAARRSAGVRVMQWQQAALSRTR